MNRKIKQKINSDMAQTNSKKLNAFLQEDENLSSILNMHSLQETHVKDINIYQG